MDGQNSGCLRMGCKGVRGREPSELCYVLYLVLSGSYTNVFLPEKKKNQALRMEFMYRTHQVNKGF